MSGTWGRSLGTCLTCLLLAGPALARVPGAAPPGVEGPRRSPRDEASCCARLAVQQKNQRRRQLDAAWQGRLRVRCTGPGGQIFIDGVEAGAARVDRWLDPGVHWIECHARGREPVRRKVEVAPGALVEARLTTKERSRLLLGTGMALLVLPHNRGDHLAMTFPLQLGVLVGGRLRLAAYGDFWIVPNWEAPQANDSCDGDGTAEGSAYGGGIFGAALGLQLNDNAYLDLAGGYHQPFGGRCTAWEGGRCTKDEAVAAGLAGSLQLGLSIPLASKPGRGSVVFFAEAGSSTSLGPFLGLGVGFAMP